MTLDTGSLGRAAAILIEARETVAQIDALPEDCRPQTAADGYAIQDRVALELGYRVLGWKIGCTAVDQQRALGVTEPFAGRLFAPLVQDSPGIFAASAFVMRGIEVEFAFRTARELPPRPSPYAIDEVAEAVAALHPGIEIVSCRFRNWRSVGSANLIADNGVNGAFVFGPAVEAWRDRDLAAHQATLTINGRQACEGRGEKVLGNPLNALTWLVNHLSERGLGLEADRFVTTGTCLGIHSAEAGDEIIADFGDLGRAQVRFTG